MEVDGETILNDGEEGEWDGYVKGTLAYRWRKASVHSGGEVGNGVAAGEDDAMKEVTRLVFITYDREREVVGKVEQREIVEDGTKFGAPAYVPFFSFFLSYEIPNVFLTTSCRPNP